MNPCLSAIFYPYCDQAGDTALTAAAASGFKATVEALLQLGANPNIADKVRGGGGGEGA